VRELCDITLALPRTVGATGVTATLWPELDAAGAEGLRASAELLKGWG
jgi:L-lactate dehydrogenase